MKRFLNAAEVAKLLQVDRATITRWIKRGSLPAQRVDNSRWRIPVAAYGDLINK
jgi:excisionase family DNA binding protein